MATKSKTVKKKTTLPTQRTVLTKPEALKLEGDTDTSMIHSVVLSMMEKVLNTSYHGNWPSGVGGYNIVEMKVNNLVNNTIQSPVFLKKFNDFADTKLEEVFSDEKIYDALVEIILKRLDTISETWSGEFWSILFRRVVETVAERITLEAMKGQWVATMVNGAVNNLKIDRDKVFINITQKV